MQDVARTKEVKKEYKILVGKPETRYYFENLDTDWSTILKCTLELCACVKTCTTLQWLCGGFLRASDLSLFRNVQIGHVEAQLVEAQCYKPEGRGFESRLYHWSVSMTRSYRQQMALGMTQPLTGTRTRNIS